MGMGILSSLFGGNDDPPQDGGVHAEITPAEEDEPPRGGEVWVSYTPDEDGWFRSW